MNRVSVCNAAQGKMKVVEVHPADNKSNDLLYRAGTLLPTGDIFWQESRKYTTGLAPSIAFCGFSNQIKVVEVHQSLKGDLWYRVGELPMSVGENTIEWKADGIYDNGVCPSIAVCPVGNDYKIIAVHMTEGGTVYRVGTLEANATTICWHKKDKKKKFASGYHQSLTACMHDGQIKIIEAHKSLDHDTLWCHVGTLDPSTNTIRWGKSQKYDDGDNQSITACNAAEGIRVIQTKSTERGELWYKSGGLNADDTLSVDSDERGYYGLGTSSYVASSTTTDDPRIVEVHRDKTHNPFCCRTGSIQQYGVAWDRPDYVNAAETPATE